MIASPRPVSVQQHPRTDFAAFLDQRRETLAASWERQARQKFGSLTGTPRSEPALLFYPLILIEDLLHFLRGKPGTESALDMAEPPGGLSPSTGDDLLRSIQESNLLGRIILEEGLEVFADTHHTLSKEDLRAIREGVRDFFDATTTTTVTTFARPPAGEGRSLYCQTPLTGESPADRAQSELARLTEVFERSPSFIAVVHGSNHVFERANESFYQLIDHRDILEKPVREALPELSEQGLLKLLDRVYTTGQPYYGSNVQMFLQNEPEGPLREHFLDFIYLPMRTSEGTIDGVCIHGVDRTCYHVAERRLEELTELSEQRRLALDSAQMGWWHYDPTSGRVHCDERFKAIHGIGPEELDCEQTVSLVHSDDRERVETAIAAALRPHEPVPYAIEYRIRHGDGSVRWVAARGQVNFAGDGADRWAVSFVGTMVDITERREVENALRRSETGFRQLADSMPQIVWSAQPDGTIDYYSQQWYEFTGLPPGTVGEAPWKAIVHPDDLGPMLVVWNASMASGEPYESECRLRRAADGVYRWFLGRARPVKNAGGDVLRWFGTSTDITERKAIEEAMEATAERLRLAMETTRSGTWDWNLETGVTYWSRAHNEMYDLPLEQRLGNYEQWLARVHPDDRQPVSAELAAAIAARRDFVFETRTLHRDGSQHWITTTGRALYDATGKPVRMLGVARDNTSQRRAREALRESEERFRLANVHAPFPVMMHASDGEVLLVNDAWTHRTGYAAEALATVENWVQRACATETDRVEVRAHLARIPEYMGALESPARRVRCADGTERIWDFSSANLGRLPDGRWLHITTATDVTARHQDEAALRQAKEEAERANAAKSLFLSRMSHELRTPLNAILGFGQVLSLSALNEQDAQCVKYILKGGQHLLSLVDEVLDLSRVDAGELALKPTAVSLDQLALECVNFVGKLAQVRRVVCTVEAGLACQRRVWADEQRLRQVLLNLLSNAIKYNRDGGKVTLRCTGAEDNRIRLQVADTGPGIAPEGLTRLFVPFERLGHEYGEVEGSGLGLVVSKRLVEAMHGTLGVESQTGQGTTFWVELPAVDAPAELPPPRARVVKPAAATTRRDVEPLTLLYVEDNVSNLQVMKTVVERLRPHWRFLAATDGPSGLEQARQARPDLVLLDLQLPGLKGDEVLIELRHAPATRQTPVLMLSADATTHSRERLLSLGANDYLPKPFNVYELLGKLDALVSTGGPKKKKPSKMGRAIRPSGKNRRMLRE